MPFTGSQNFTVTAPTLPPLSTAASGGALSSSHLPLTLTCVLSSSSSTPPSTPLTPPRRYSASTLLRAPLAYLPSSQPTLAAVLAESRVSAGLLRGLGGLAAGSGPFQMPLFDASCAGVATNATAALFWNATALGACSPAMAAVEAFAASLPFAPSQLSSVISRRTTLLLIAPRLQPFPSANLTVSLGGLELPLLWLSPSRAVAAAATPPFSALSAALDSSSGGSTSTASSVAVLSLREGGVGLLTARAAALQAPLPLPSLYPPFLLQQTPLPAAAAAAAPSLEAQQILTSAPLVSLTASALQASVAAQVNPALGLRLVAQCSDPLFAPAEQCELINGTQPLLSAGNALLGPGVPRLSCAWGGGDDCVPCPTPGAMCPGGRVLLPLPGYWVPSVTSPPGDLTPCPFPDPRERCPGFESLLAPSLGGSGGAEYACGEGYRGPACGSCAAGYFPRGGRCAQCPSYSSTALAIVVPLAAFVGGLAVLGLVLLASVQASLRLPGFSRLPLRDTAQRVLQLLLWVFTATQALVSLCTVAQFFSPPALAPYYGAILALQFQGVSTDPRCLSVEQPFLSLYTLLGMCAGLLVVLAASLGLAGMRHSLPAPPLSAASSAGHAKGSGGGGSGGWVGGVAPGAFKALILLYGVTNSVFLDTLTCAPPIPMTVADYIALTCDGSALGTAHLPFLSGASPPSLAELRRGLRDPLYATSAGLSPVLSAPLRVSLLRSNPDIVCREGAHGPAYTAASTGLALYSILFPLGALATLWVNGRLCAAPVVAPAVAAAAVAPAAVPKCSAFLHLLTQDDSLQPHSQWLLQKDLLLTLLLQGLVAVAQNGSTGLTYMLAMGSCAAAALASAAVGVVKMRFTQPHSWKAPIAVLLDVCSSLTAALACVSVSQIREDAALEPSLAAGLGAVPLALGGLLALALLCLWWRRILLDAKKKRLLGGAEGLSAGGWPESEGTQVTTFSSPLVKPSLEAFKEGKRLEAEAARLAAAEEMAARHLAEAQRAAALAAAAEAERLEAARVEAEKAAAAAGAAAKAGGGGGGNGDQAPPDEPHPPPIASIPTGMDSHVTRWDCAGCGKALDPKAALMCMGCRKAVYCNRECSRMHVKEHWDPCYKAVRERVYAGDVHKGDAAGVDGAAGEVVLKACIIRARGNYGDKDERTLEGLAVYGTFLHWSGRLGEAEPLYREALAGRRATLGPMHTSTLTSMNNFAQLLQDQGKLGEAEPLMRETLEVRRATLGPMHPDTLNSMSNLALLLQDQGKLEEAEPLMWEHFELCRDTLGPMHPDTLTSMSNLAQVLQHQGKLEEAEPLMREMLEIQGASLGQKHPGTLCSMSNLAALLKSQGKLGEAEPLFRVTLEVRRATLGPKHPDTLTSMSNFAQLLKAQGKLGEAEPLCRETLEIRRATLGPKHPGTLTSMNNLAVLLHGQGKLAESEVLFKEAVEGRRVALGPQHPHTLNAERWLAQVSQQRKGGGGGEGSLGFHVNVVRAGRDAQLVNQHAQILLNEKLAGMHSTLSRRPS